MRVQDRSSRSTVFEGWDTERNVWWREQSQRNGLEELWKMGNRVWDLKTVHRRCFHEIVLLQGWFILMNPQALVDTRIKFYDSSDLRIAEKIHQNFVIISHFFNDIFCNINCSDGLRKESYSNHLKLLSKVLRCSIIGWNISYYSLARFPYFMLIFLMMDEDGKVCWLIIHIFSVPGPMFPASNCQIENILMFWATLCVLLPNIDRLGCVAGPNCGVVNILRNSRSRPGWLMREANVFLKACFGDIEYFPLRHFLENCHEI